MTAAPVEAASRPPDSGGLTGWLKPPLRAFTAFVAVVVAVLIGLTVDRCRDIYFGGHENAAQNVIRRSTELARQASQTIASIDATILGVVDAVELTDRQGTSSDVTVALIRRRLGETPQIRDLIVLDMAGRPRFVAGETLVSMPELASPDFLTVRGESAQGRGLMAGSPIIASGLGYAIIPMSRRFDGPDGQSGGLVAALVASDVLTEALRPGGGPDSELVGLWSSTGTLLARSQMVPGMVGQVLGSEIASRFGARGEPSAAVTIASPIDGERRIVARAAVPGFPFVIAVATSEAALNDVLWRQIAETIGMALLRLAVVVGFALLLMRQIRRAQVEAAALRAKQERLQDFASAASDWHWETDAAMRFTDIVDTRGHRSDATRAAFVGRTVRETNPEGVSAEQWAEHEAIVRARLPFRDFRMKRGRPGGRLRHYAINGVPIFDAAGRFAGYRGTGRDVTAETESADTLRAVIDAVPAMISAKDTSQRFIFMNSYQAALYGTTPDASLGRTPSELLGAVAGSHAGALDRRVVETGTSTGFFEERFTGADGIARDWLSAKLPIRAPSGDIKFVLTVSMDITAQKTAEKQLRQAHADLIRAKETAEQASVAKSEFLANVSHELRTPLNAIIGFSEIMSAAMYGPIGSERYAGYVRDINHSALYLLDLINDILDMAKIEAGKRELQHEPVDVVAEIDDTIRMFAQRVSQEGIRLVPQMPEWPAILQADRRAVRQVLINIIGNAVKFTPRGRSIYVSLERTESMLDIVVRDEGTGIPADQIEKLGTPFFQVNDYAARSKAGSGLGLALTKSLVALHGGTLAIESQLGQGTAVVISLPLAPDGARATTEPSAA